MSIHLTILCENSVDRVRPIGLLGEHGFACHLRTEQGDFLFDTGGGLTIVNNAERLGIPLEQLKGLIFSHGHSDHTGGVRKVLEKSGPLPIYGHPDLFNQRYSHNGQKPREIGMPWSRAELEQLGATFHLDTTPQEIAPGLMLSGAIPRIHKEETGDPNLIVMSADRQQAADPLNDDLSLFISSEKGLIILLGCANAGLLNIIEHALKVTGQNKIHMILGGTHLKFCSDEQMEATLRRLTELDVDKIGASHCTGLKGASILARHFGHRFFPASVGEEIVL